MVVLILDIPISYFADKKGYSISFKGSVISAGISYLILGFANHFYTFLCAEFFNALSILLFGGAFQAMLFDSTNYLKKSYQFYNGKLSRNSHIAMLCTATLGGIILFTIQSKVTFWQDYVGLFFLFTSIAFIALYVFSLLMLTNTASPKAKTDNKNTGYQQFKNDLLLIYNFLKSTNITLLSASYIIFAVAFNILASIWQPMLVKMLSEAVPALLLSAIFSLVMISQSIAGSIVSHYVKKQIIWIMVCFLLLSFICNISLPSPSNDSKNLAYVIFGINVFCVFMIVRLGLSLCDVSLLEEFKGKSETKATMLSIVATFVRGALFSFLLQQHSTYCRNTK